MFHKNVIDSARCRTRESMQPSNCLQYVFSGRILQEFFYTDSNNYLPTNPPYVLFPTIIAGFGHLPKSITNNKNNEKYKSNYKEWPSISIIGCINGLTIAPSRSSIACPQTPALISPIAIKAVKKA